MKIEFVTQDDPLYVLPFFEEFFARYAKEFEILHISCSRAMGKRPRMKLMRELLGLYGLVGSVRIVMRLVRSRLLAGLPRRPQAGRYETLQQLCRAYGVPYSHIGTPNAPEFLQQVKERSADTLVSVACPYIWKDELLKIPPRGCINIHHAPLPRYKGMMPTFWQMYHGEKKVGVTIHYMAAKVDEGSALLQDSLAIEPGETLDHLIRRSKRHGAQCMARVLRQVAQGTQKEFSLNQAEGTYFTFPTLAEIREFHRRGLRPI